MAKTTPVNVPPDPRARYPYPYPEFPLTAHPSGQWSKKVRGKVRYFGVWANWEAALTLYKEQLDDLQAGRSPSKGEGLTVKELVNAFLKSKEDKVASGENSNRTFDDYFSTAALIVSEFGKTTKVADVGPRDFERLRAEFAKLHGPFRLSKDVGCTKTIFKYAKKFGVDVVFDDSFQKPSRAVMRKHKQARPKKVFEPGDIHAILALLDKDRTVTVRVKRKEREQTRYASPVLKAMVFLGINAALGNQDIAMLPQAALDLENGWLDYARVKNGIPRRAKLWPETVKALKAAIAVRPTPRNPAHADLVFVTSRGQPWAGIGTTKKGRAKIDNPISKEFAKVLKELDLVRSGRGFYALRHTLNSVAKQLVDGI